MNSAYRKSFSRKQSMEAIPIDHKLAFNLEKEAKIINPHKMELKTTNHEDYRGKKGQRSTPKLQVKFEGPKPIQRSSSYTSNFPNWLNGNKDIFHESRPQYPVYSLPFRGSSTNNDTYQESLDKAKDQAKRVNNDSGKLV